MMKQFRPSPHRRPSPGHLLAIASLVLVAVSFGAGQAFTRKPKTNSQIKAAVVPFPFLDKTSAFVNVRPSRKDFLEMVAFCATYPKGFAKLGEPHKVTQLEYGYKKGGIIRLYETPVVKGTTASAFLKAVLASHAFRDVNGRPGFSTEVIANPSLFILLTSNSKSVMAVAKADL